MKNRRIKERRTLDRFADILFEDNKIEMRWHERRCDGIELPDELFEKIKSKLICHRFRPARIKLVSLKRYEEARCESRSLTSDR